MSTLQTVRAGREGIASTIHFNDSPQLTHMDHGRTSWTRSRRSLHRRLSRGNAFWRPPAPAAMPRIPERTALIDAWAARGIRSSQKML
eukprot:4912307-Prymnesium_polylepis.1